MDKIDWCKKQGKGIKLIEPNDNISKDYFFSAEESLKVLKKIQGTESCMWLATTKYYCEYFAAYAFLIKCGIKSEIHDCTIEFSKILEEKGFLPQGTYERLNFDKDLRIDNQYYLKNRPVEIDSDDLADFLIQMRQCIDLLNLEKVELIRSLI